MELTPDGFVTEIQADGPRAPTRDELQAVIDKANAGERLLNREIAMLWGVTQQAIKKGEFRAIRRMRQIMLDAPDTAGLVVEWMRGELRLDATETTTLETDDA